MLDQKPDTAAIGIVAPCHKIGDMIAHILTKIGWKIDGIFVLQDQPLDTKTLTSSTAGFDQNNIPIDRSALFAGRHFGVLKDAEDYLAWEEDLPDQIPPVIINMWHDRLAQTNK